MRLAIPCTPASQLESNNIKVDTIPLTVHLNYAYEGVI